MTRHSGTRWWIAGQLLPLALLLPISVGLLGVLLPTFGFHPGLNETSFSLQAINALTGDPSFGQAIWTTLISGLGGAFLSVGAAFGFCASIYHTPWFKRLRAPLSAALALPHVSFAVGFAFLLAPSGFLARLISPEISGWQQPPDFLIVGDPWALCLLIGLALKETLFLVLMIISALGQVRADAMVRTAQSYGYGPVRAFMLIIAPQIYRQIRIPISAVIASSVGSIDLALVLGPSAPPTLAVLVLNWFGDFDLELQFQAAAGASTLLLISLVAIGIWDVLERLTGQLGRLWIWSGRRSGWADIAIAAFGQSVAGLSLFASLLSVLVLLIWSFAGQWQWPEALPMSWSLSHWGSSMAAIIKLSVTTIGLACISTLLALILCLIALEARDKGGRSRPQILPLLPLLLPQASFLFGVTILWSALHWDGSVAIVIWTHLLFVGPYIYLSLHGPFQALDPRSALTARTLGKTRWETFLKVKIPLLVRPILTAAAIGFSVSVTLYLPTLVAGAGRISTLATETLALASGGDRKTLGVIAISLTVLPFLALLASLGLSDFVATRRKGLHI